MAKVGGPSSTALTFSFILGMVFNMIYLKYSVSLDVSNQTHLIISIVLGLVIFRLLLMWYKIAIILFICHIFYTFSCYSQVFQEQKEKIVEKCSDLIPFGTKR